MNNALSQTEVLELARKAAIAAGQLILEIYQRDDFEIQVKSDQSPLTLADRTAHQCIKEHLQASQLPLLSEEGREIPYSERQTWPRFWMVDPLDGTKEFIKRNGEFTVNIALIEGGQPILGVIYVPVSQELFWGGHGLEAFKKSLKNGIPKETQKLQSTGRKQHEAGLRVVASRSHLNAETQAFLDQLSDPETVSMGSSLKFMLLAEGKADFYPRYAPTMEWDTAAAQAILEAAGGQVQKADGSGPLQYNKANLLNPYFLAQG